MTFYLLADALGWEEKHLIQTANELGIKIELILNKDLSFNLGTDNFNGKGYSFLERSWSFSKGLTNARILEKKGNKVLNSSAIIDLCGNKVNTAIFLNQNNIMTPKTIITYSEKSAIMAAEKIGYPIVLKPILGGYGKLVSLVENKETLVSLLEHKKSFAPSFFNIYLIQEKIDIKRDLRVITVGEEAVSIMERKINRDCDWRANTALGALPSAAIMTEEIRLLSEKVAKSAGGGILGIDIFETSDGEILVNELNHCFKYKNSIEKSSVNISRKILEYFRDL